MHGLKALLFLVSTTITVPWG